MYINTHIFIHTFIHTHIHLWNEQCNCATRRKACLRAPSLACANSQTHLLTEFEGVRGVLSSEQHCPGDDTSVSCK